MVLLSRVEAPDWSAEGDPEYEARCRKLPRPHESDDPFFETAQEADALMVCNGNGTEFPPCPMRHECLIFSLINHEGSGIWGGMRLEDRMYMKRNMEESEWRWHPPSERPQRAQHAGESCVSLAA